MTVVVNAELGGDGLEGTLAALSRQTLPRDRFEILVVAADSGDPAFQSAGADDVLLGPGDPRNHVVSQVRGRWVTFLEAGDQVPSTYLADASSFLVANPSVEIALAAGGAADPMPTPTWRWAPRACDELRRVFFLVERVRRAAVRFSSEIPRPIRDTMFCARYLLSMPSPLVAHIAGNGPAVRRRRFLHEAGATQAAYHVALRDGLLRLLKEASGPSGRAPMWLQHAVLRQVAHLFEEEETQAGPTVAENAGVVESFHGALADITSVLDAEAISSYPDRLSRASVDILRHAYRNGAWFQDEGLDRRVAQHEGMVRIAYRFTGPAPKERFRAGEQAVHPLHEKVRTIPLFGRIVMLERIIWLPADPALRIEVGGRDLGRVASREPGVEPVAYRRRRRDRTLADRVVGRLARAAVVRWRFGNAWVFMDRILDAHDNAEHLFRHIRATRRADNAWFVLDRGSSDWRRLRREFGSRVVAHGSLRWRLLMLNCRHLISSHVDRAIIRPSAILRSGRPRWRFTFLQHGVIQSDLSRWLNRKRIDLFVTSTPSERDSIAANGTPYVFTTKEVRLTGLPRFDRLQALHQRTVPAERDLLLVAPTWRAELAPLVSGDQSRRRVHPDFRRSEFAEQWSRVLASERLHAAAVAQGCEVAILLHPNLQDAAEELVLPAHVHRLRFTESDVQRLFSRAKVLMTDYSSIAFDVAFIDRPIVYFQFDTDTVLGGRHVGRPGYFDYRRDGFGPVATTADDAVDAVVAVLQAGAELSSPYAERVATSFPLRDDGACDRVIREIQRLDGGTAPQKRPDA